VKYTPERGRISFQLRCELADDHKLLLLTEIRDTGIGMSTGFQKVLFEPFSQENQTVQAEAHGTGLGLSIVKQLVDIMGGTIRVESRLGRGDGVLSSHCKWIMWRIIGSGGVKRRWRAMISPCLKADMCSCVRIIR
jgi:K+-sensing histidine kinase KdpD